MLSLLFNPNFWYSMIAVAVACGITYLCIKYASARVITAVVLFMALVTSSVYASIKLNQYYSADGGIYGYISTIFKNNNVEQMDQYKFNLTNINMKLSSNADEYVAVFDSEIIVELADSDKYALFLNGVPCSYVGANKDYVSADFYYNFYGTDRKLLLSDTLNVSISFDNKGTHIYLTTKGGSTASRYWNKYFDKNNFIVEIKNFDYKASELNDFNSNGTSGGASGTINSPVNEGTWV